MPVNDGRQIHEASVSSDIGDITAPHFIWIINLYLFFLLTLCPILFEKIRIDLVFTIFKRGYALLCRVDCLYTENGHIFEYSILTDRVTVFKELSMDESVTVF